MTTGQSDSDTASGSVSSATASATGTSTSATTTDGSTSGFKFDLGPIPDAGSGEGCGDTTGGGNLEFSNIWIANSGENTVSKIDTFTVTEVGRYLVHPPNVNGGSPSRTSVNLNGDMAVANRCNLNPAQEGCAGITMVVARLEDCVDLNNNGMIDTSTGPNDVRAWGEDECVLWHTPLTSRSNRPVAWTSGTFNKATCAWEDPKVWTATVMDSDTTKAKVYLLNGATGDIEQDLTVDGWDGNGHGIYGGAVDSNNDFWFVGGYANLLGHVRISDFSHEVITGGSTPYGSMVDADDRIWRVNGTMSRYDPMAKVWDTQSCGQGCTAITQDADGWVWVGGTSNFNQILKVDPDTMQIVDQITEDDIPEMGSPWGLSVDAEGYLWAVEMGTKAFKIDTADYSYDIFQNSSFMYTYSDMTGFGLKNVAGNPSG